MNHDVDAIVLIIGLLEILDESVVRGETCLLGLLLVQVDDVTLDKLCEVADVVLLLLLLHGLLLLLHLVLHGGLLFNFHHLKLSDFPLFL